MTKLTGRANDETSGLAELVEAWRLFKASPDALKTSYQLTPSPYPGLRSFEPSESLLYFGRPGEEEDLAARLERHNVVGVLGGSGSGKSSLVLAGLLPYLKRFQRIPERGGRWYLVHTRPSKDPISAIVDAIWEGVFAPLQNRKFGARALMATFGSSGLSSDLVGEELFTASKRLLRRFLVSDDALTLNPAQFLRFANKELQILDSVSSGGMQVEPANLLIVIDQFEELFRKELDPASVESVINLIKAVNRAQGQGLFIAFTMRSEEMHRCAEHDGLSAIIFASSVQVELLTKTEDIHAAIVESVRRVFDSWNVQYCRVGVTGKSSPFSQELITFLTDEVQRLSKVLDHKPDSLPLLQHALHTIWDTALARWERAMGTSDTEFLPQLTLSDFLYKDDPKPLQRCLDKCADGVRQQALQSVIEKMDGEPEAKEQAAARLVDIAFICLARMDENNRWIRRWASAESIASESILELQGSVKRGFIGSLLGASWRQTFSQPRVDKTALVSMALEIFRHNGYLSRNKDTYDVSHESLIRSWSHYQLILQQAKATRKALIEADEALQTVDTNFEESWFRRSLLWFYGGVSKHAFDALRRVNTVDLERLFKPPRWLGEVWAREQLVDEWKRRGNTAGTSFSTFEGDAERQDEVLRNEAAARVSRIRDFFRSASAWSEWEGLRPPKRIQRLAAVGSVPTMVVFSLVLALGLVFFTSQLVAFLKDISTITDESARADPVTARNSLLPLLSRAQDLSKSDSITSLATALAAGRQEKHPIDSATEILAQKARYVLTFVPGKIGNAELFTLYKKKTGVTCGKANRSDIINVLEFQFKYFSPNKAPPGYGFFPKNSTQNSSVYQQTAFFDFDDTVCIANDASILLRIQPSGLILYPLTLVHSPKGNRAVHFNDPVPVVVYDHHGQRAEAEFSNGLISELFGHVNDQQIEAFSTSYTQGLKIQIKENATGTDYLYVTHLLGINQPQRATSLKACSLFLECKASSLGSFRERLIEGLAVGGLSYKLKISIYRRGNSSCRFDEEICPQRLLLYRTISRGEEADQVKLFEQTHVGLPIVDAVMDDGYLLLLDTSGNIWRYVIEWDALSAAVRDAGPFTFPSEAASTARDESDFK